MLPKLVTKLDAPLSAVCVDTLPPFGLPPPRRKRIIR